MIRKIDDFIYVGIQRVSELVEFFTGARFTTQAKFLTLVVCCMFPVYVWKLHIVDTVSLSLLIFCMTGLVYIIFTLSSRVESEYTSGTMNFYRGNLVFLYARFAHIIFVALIIVFGPNIYFLSYQVGITVSLYLLGCQPLPPGKKSEVLQKVHI